MIYLAETAIIKDLTNLSISLYFYLQKILF